MPVKIQKIKGTSRYTVSTPGGTKAKSTTKANAQGQANLLRGIEHGWVPTGKPAKRKGLPARKGKETGIYDMGPGMPPKGMHKMPGGHMMKDSEMMMKGKAKAKAKAKKKK